MTAHQETRFSCDRCGIDEVIPIVNSGPVERRMAGPETWTMIRVGPDPTIHPRHLCPMCSDLFTALMAGLPKVEG